MRDGAEIAKITGELFEPGCIIIATLVISVLGFVMWHFSLKEHGNKVPTPARGSGIMHPRTPAIDSSRRSALNWLAALVATSLLLLIFQVGAGFATGALTLIADSAHTAADAVSYAFSWFVERAKCSVDGVQSEKAKGAAVRFDIISAVFSVFIVLGTSACATADAIRRLRGPGSELGAKAAADNDLGLIGPALLGFAILSTAANCGLLALHQRRQLAAAPAAPVPAPSTPELGDSQGDSEDSFMCSPCLPPPMPVQAKALPEGSATNSSTLVYSKRSRERAARRAKHMKWLHQAFHPSCSDADCPVDGKATSNPYHPDNGVDPPGSKADFGVAFADDQSNLNLYGAVLHLITDVLRSLVILVVALLVQLGIIRDAPTADAMCAIAVSICILCGSVALLRAAAACLRAWQITKSELGVEFSLHTV